MNKLCLTTIQMDGEVNREVALIFEAFDLARRSLRSGFAP